MPVADVIAKVSAARFQEAYQQANIWAGLVNDLSAEIPGYGDTLDLPSDTSTYTVTDISSTYTVDATIANAAWGPPTGINAARVQLQLNKAYKVNTLVTSLQQRRVRPSFLESAMRHSAREMTEQVNKDIRETFDAAAAAQKLPHIETTAANFGNAAHQKLIFDKLGEAQEKVAYLHWPPAGRVCVVSPAYYNALVTYLINEKLFLIRGGTDDALNMGILRDVRGFDVMQDNSLPEGKTNTDDANHTMYFLNRGVGVAYAGEMRELRARDSEDYIGYRLQGVMTYGTVIAEPSKILICEASIT